MSKSGFDFGVYMYTRNTTIHALKDSEDWMGFEFDKNAGSGKVLVYAYDFAKMEAALDAYIVRPPGALLGTISEFVFSKKTLERVVRPIIADMQTEYFEALAAKRRYKAKWIRIRGCWSFWKALGLYSLLKAAVEMWRKVS